VPSSFYSPFIGVGRDIDQAHTRTEIWGTFEG
jgi:hypothetical protein